MRIAIVGYYNDDMGKNSTNCFSVMSMLLTEALRRRNHIVFPYHILNGGVGDQPVDVVITILFDSDNVCGGQFWKNKLKARKVVSFLETPNGGVDHAFIFNPDFSKHCKDPHTLLKYPMIDITENKKEQRSVLIDHCWPDFKMQGFQRDLSKQISDWMVDLDFKVYKHTRFEEDLKLLKSSEIPIPVKPYRDYIETIKSIETFIVTHTESFAYGVLDFISVGSKVMAPENCLPKFLIENFNITTFSNKKTLIDGLCNNSKIEYDVNNFYTYNQISEILEQHFDSWI